MKISPIQVTASALAALASAVLLSFLGDKGTYVGVALGSIIATIGSAAIGESLRRGHSKVKEVAGNQQWHVPGARTGSVQASAASSATLGTDAGSRAPAGPTGTDAGNVAASPTAPRTQRTSPATPGETVRPLARYSTADRSAPPGPPPSTRAQTAAGSAAAGPSHRRTSSRGLIFGVRWPILLAVTVLVAAIALAAVFIIEAASGQSLGHSLGGAPSPTPTTVPAATTTTTAPKTTTTTVPSSTTTTAPRTTTTTAPTATTTVPTTTVPAGGSVGSSATTTTTTTSP